MFHDHATSGEKIRPNVQSSESLLYEWIEYCGL